ncbi:Fungal lipase-like domain [Dillenia turbinata]|uniref:Phospholipase A1 n=1 Tax=Dillenia turbinata TaxID=194707 RepID=A0AAN8YYD1_9MAGN
MECIAHKWRQLSGHGNWENLLDPLDLDMRQYLIHYGEMAQATYNNFNAERASKYCGESRYSREDLFARVGLVKNHHMNYTVTKYFYAASKLEVPESFLVKSLSPNPWCKESNWMGFLAVATDDGKKVLGRRDILVAWRGTIMVVEWFKNFDFPLVSACEILGNDSRAMVHEGWLSMYTSDNTKSPYDKSSARHQIVSEVKLLLEKYKDEETSITITGHSLGAALATLNAADIAANGYNIVTCHGNTKKIPVTVFSYSSPRIGDPNFCDACHTMENLHILRVKNVGDIIPDLPPGLYTEVGRQLLIDTQKSMYLKSPGNMLSWHELECHLHGVAGFQGLNKPFHLTIKRDISLVNKYLDALKDEYLVPEAWWVEKNKGMVHKEDGSWCLEDHEPDDQEVYFTYFLEGTAAVGTWKSDEGTFGIG